MPKILPGNSKWRTIATVVLAIGTLLVIYTYHILHNRTNYILAVDDSTGSFLDISCEVDRRVDGIDDWVWTWAIGPMDAREFTTVWEMNWNLPLCDYDVLRRGIPVAVKAKGYKGAVIFVNDKSPRKIILRLSKAISAR